MFALEYVIYYTIYLYCDSMGLYGMCDLACGGARSDELKCLFPIGLSVRRHCNNKRIELYVTKFCILNQ